MNFAELFHHEGDLYELPAGHALFKEGEDQNGYMYVLMSGVAEIWVNGRMMETAQPGTLLGRDRGAGRDHRRDGDDRRRRALRHRGCAQQLPAVAGGPPSLQFHDPSDAEFRAERDAGDCESFAPHGRGAVEPALAILRPGGTQPDCTRCIFRQVLS